MSSFEIIKSGIFTTIQDFGRYGYAKYAITNSGAMDEYAYLFLNKLLGNDFDTNALEIVFGNIKIKSNANTSIALTGALSEFYINEQRKNMWETYKIKVGDIIEIKRVLKGRTLYLGVKNGFELEKEFGSFSTTIKESIGGIEGRRVIDGDILEIKDTFEYKKRVLGSKYIPKYNKTLKLRVIPSYQYNKFEEKELEKFFSSTFNITNEFDRMGCRLDGEEKINYTNKGIISEAIAYGSIQIPKDGNPIILLKDRQTVGGYPKIGAVIPIDCFKLAQLNPNDKINFKKIDLETAQKKMRKFYTYFKK